MPLERLAAGKGDAAVVPVCELEYAEKAGIVPKGTYRILEAKKPWPGAVLQRVRFSRRNLCGGVSGPRRSGQIALFGAFGCRPRNPVRPGHLQRIFSVSKRFTVEVSTELVE